MICRDGLAHAALTCRDGQEYSPADRWASSCGTYLHWGGLALLVLTCREVGSYLWYSPAERFTDICSTHLQRCGLVFVVLCVGLQVVNVDGGQAWDEQLQLLLREDGHQLLGDDVIESFKEGVELFADGPRHLHLAHQLDILPLVLLCDRYVIAVGHELPSLRHTKLLDLGTQRTFAVSRQLNRGGFMCPTVEKVMTWPRCELFLVFLPAMAGWDFDMQLFSSFHTNTLPWMGPG